MTEQRESFAQKEAKVICAQPVSVILPDIGIRRQPPRPKHLQDPTYAEKFDDSTLFYDIVFVGEDIVLSGPPLLNLESFVINSEVYVDGVRAQFERTTSLERSQTTVFSLPQQPQDDVVNIEIYFPEWDWRFRSEIDVSINRVMAGSNVLMTLQRNEELLWIEDWVRYYATNQSVDAVVIYDNGSDKYSLDSIANVVATVPGIQTVVVVDWDFKYGPQGSPWVGPGVPWDSDFCQIGALQNCRFKWSLFANGWINADVDELFVSRGPETIFDALEKSSDGVVGVSGTWISNEAVGYSGDEVPRYWYFPYFSSQQCNPKWAMCSNRVDPSAHPTAHYVRGIDGVENPNFFLAHFRPLNSGWKIPGRRKVEEPREFRASSLDELLLMRVIANAFRVTDAGKAIRMTMKRSLSADGIEYEIDKSLVLPWIFSALRKTPAFSKKWSKAWLWRDEVFVLEYPANGTNVAFDLAKIREDLSLSAVVRESGYASSFKDQLKLAFGDELGFEKPSKLGFEVFSANVQEDWILLYDRAVAVVNEVMGIMPME